MVRSKPRSNADAPPEIANHAASPETKSFANINTNGTAIHKLKQYGQSIRRPTKLAPAFKRSLTIMSNGPSSRAIGCAIRHVTRLRQP